MCQNNIQKDDKWWFRTMREGGEQGAKISGIEEEKGLEIEIKIKLKKG